MSMQNIIRSPASTSDLGSKVMIRQLLLLPVLAALGSAPQALGSEPRETPIIAFADPVNRAQIATENADLSVVTGTPVNQGGSAARVEFRAAGRSELTIRPTEAPADWSNVASLAIPV